MTHTSCVATGLVALVTASPCAMAGGAPCSESPEVVAEQIFTEVEAARTGSDLREIYKESFSDKFKALYSFDTFQSEALRVQENLGIGAQNSRRFQSRLLPGVGPMPAQAYTKAQSGLVQVDFVASSPYGKVLQRAVMGCAPRGWVAEGIWYSPLGQQFK